MRQKTKFKETEIGKIPEDWEVKKLSGFCDILMGQSPPSSAYNFDREGLPFFQGCKDFGIKFPTTTMWCTEPTRIANAGEVLLSVRAPVGDVNLATEKCCIGRGLSALSMKNENKQFLYYLLLHNQQRLKQIFESEGTVFGCVTKNGLTNFEVAVPSEKGKQRAIAKILSDLDDKIELNNQINSTLESIAQAIFKRWFVDFEFLDKNGKPYKSSGSKMVDSELGEIPEGWAVKEISDCGEVICGKTPPTADKDNYGDDIFFITIPDMRGQAFAIKTERKLSRRGASIQKKKELPPLSICVSCIATPGLVSITSDISHTNQQINSIICKKDISPYFMYYTMLDRSEEIKSMGLGGTATLNLNTGNFSRIKTIIPKQTIIEYFHELVTPIMERMLSNLRENISLCEIRDSLLPRLISGKLLVRH